MSTEQELAKQQNLRRVVGSSVIGAVIEWYDFFLYGVVAGLVFNKLYFPDFDPTVGTMMAFATFAVGFVARPIGGLIFGHYGDKLGRKKVLIITLQLMGVSTVAMGCIPSYESIGIWAPLLLTFCRLIQGIGLGGEWGGGVLMAFESAPENKRGLYASLPQVGLSLGLLLATGVIGILSFVLSEEAFFQWGWRIAFMLSSVLLFLGYYIRTRTKESSEFAESKDSAPEAKFPLLDAFKYYPKRMMACMGARCIDGVAFNVFGVYSLSYLTQHLQVSQTVALGAVMAASVVMSFAIPFWGHMADKYGKTKLYGLCAIILGLSCFPAFWTLHNYSDNLFLLYVAIIIPFGIVYAAVFGIMSSLFAEAFPARVRYSGISFVYQFTAIFAAGLTPMVATYLTGIADGEPWYLCAYLAIMGTLSAISTMWVHHLNVTKTEMD
ncbi:MAG: MFS transporter [Pseudomonadota bacterium]